MGRFLRKFASETGYIFVSPVRTEGNSALIIVADEGDFLDVSLPGHSFHLFPFNFLGIGSA